MELTIVNFDVFLELINLHFHNNIPPKEDNNEQNYDDFKELKIMFTPCRNGCLHDEVRYIGAQDFDESEVLKQPLH